LNLTAALANVDPAMEEAAENLGCTGFRKFRRITLPLIMPGLFAGGIIVFIFAFTELGVPLIFDYARTTPVQIFYGIKEMAGNPFPFALVVVMLASTALLYLASKLAFGNSDNAMTAKATTGGGARAVGPLARWACTLAFCAVTAVALLPHIGVILVSFAGEWYRTVLPTHVTLAHYNNALGHYLTVPSIVNSLKYASAATLFDVLLGVAIAYVVVRTTLPGRGVLDALAMMPLAVPGLVLAFGYISMTQDGKVFAALNPSKDPTLLLVIAYAVRRLPCIVRSAVAGLQQTSVTLEEAAQNLGCPPLRALRRVTLPLIAANVLAGGLLAFSFAMLEVSDSLILAQKTAALPNHQGDLRTVPTARRRPLRRQRARRLGDGFPRHHHLRREPHSREEAGGAVPGLARSRFGAPQLCRGLFEPRGVGLGVGAEGFEGAFVLVVEERAVEAEGARFRGVDEAGGVVGTHLEDDAHFKFAQGLPVHRAVHIVERVDADDEVDAEAAALGDDVGQLRAGTGFAGTGGEREVILVAQFLEAVQAVDEHVDGRSAGVAIRAARFEFLGEFVHGLGDLVPARDLHRMRNGGDDVVEEISLRRAGCRAIEEDKARTAGGMLRGKSE